MQSRAVFKAHPIHPALIPFPFAFLTGALLFDVLALAFDGAFAATAAYLTIAGLISGVIAAIPGAIDYVFTVPPDSSGKTRATKHAAANVAALALFAGALALRDDQWRAGTITLGLELLGMIALGYAGWQGGMLVTRNLISVDHRYAQAGRWQEAAITARERSVVVGHVDDLKENQMKLLRVNGRRMVLARTAQGYHACDDRCSHRGGSLAGGVLVSGTVQCLWHGSQFDVATGRVVCGPAREPVRVYPVTETPDGRLLLETSART
jgi:nitrite reductase/ring-hydroxylating ferredoxin subunit/uncharacterized membrane protein